MNQLVPVQQGPPPPILDQGVMPLAEVVSRVRRIQEVMGTLMKDGVHFGTIPGTDKPTLYQPGAELLCTTFRIGPKPAVEDLSTADEIRYRVTVTGISQTTGEILGEGVGECSTSEEKYRWRRPVCDEEWQEAPEDRRREKWMRGQSRTWKAKQVRTSPADVANTVLKMAFKRALISMTRVVLACSDIFHQDLEDLPQEIRESVLEDGAAAKAEPKKEPQRASAKPAPPDPPKAEPKPAGTNGNGQAPKPAEPLLHSEPCLIVDVIPRKGQRGEFFEVHTTQGNYTLFDTKVGLELESFKDTDHAVVLHYTAREKDGRQFRNVQAFVVAEQRLPMGPAEPVGADDIDWRGQ